MMMMMIHIYELHNLLYLTVRIREDLLPSAGGSPPGTAPADPALPSGKTTTSTPLGPPPGATPPTVQPMPAPPMSSGIMGRPSGKKGITGGQG